MLAKAVPIPGGLGRRWSRRKGCSFHLSSLLLLTAACLANQAMTAETLYQPQFVQEPSPSWRTIPVAASTPATTTHPVIIQRLRHSSLLLSTPGGLPALTDPQPWQVSPLASDVVITSNGHSAHNLTRSVPGGARVVCGRATDGNAVGVNVTSGNLSAKGMRSSGGNSIDVTVQDTAFVFRAEGLGIVHLGNLRRHSTTNNGHDLFVRTS